MRRQVSIVVLVLAIAILWRPYLRPIGAGAILVGDIYSSALWDRNLAAYVTPLPRVTGTRESFGGIEMRVSWWRPGWGDRHPALLLVNGATALGNDDPETTRLAEALARAGYFVMLPEFPFIQEGTLEPRAPAIIGAAFARLLSLPETSEMRVGAFGFSVGGGMLLAAAGQHPALARASYIGALGAYYDLDTYLASVVTRTQLRAGRPAAWDPAPEVRLRLPLAAASAISDIRDRVRLEEELRANDGRTAADPPAGMGTEAGSLWVALGAPDYDLALARLRGLSPALRQLFEGLSPRTEWSAIRAPVFWLHDEGDRYEPISEAETAAANPHAGPTRFQRTALLSHAAAVGSGAKEKGFDFWATELSGLLLFAAGALGTGG
jgi:pimeloyl-ACP methyl ester carboxylesterase